MAAPNLGAAGIAHGKTAVLAATTTPTAIISAVDTGHVVKVVSLYISNVDGSVGADITVDLYRSSTAYRIGHVITVPPKSTLPVVTKDAPIYLEEGDALRLTASADGDLEGVCSYEDVS